jgi:hypothetical protein
MALLLQLLLLQPLCCPLASSASTLGHQRWLLQVLPVPLASLTLCAACLCLGAALLQLQHCPPPWPLPLPPCLRLLLLPLPVHCCCPRPQCCLASPASWQPRKGLWLQLQPAQWRMPLQPPPAALTPSSVRRRGRGGQQQRAPALPALSATSLQRPALAWPLAPAHHQ